MDKINWDVVLQKVYFFGAIYLVFNALVHLSTIRLTEVNLIWPPDASTFGSLFNQLFGSFALLAALIAFELRKDLKKYRQIIILSAFWALFHGILMIYSSLTKDYTQIFSKTPSLTFWIPAYTYFLLLEGVVLMIYSVIVYLWLRRSK